MNEMKQAQHTPHGTFTDLAEETCCNWCAQPVKAQADRDRLKAVNAELVRALNAYHEFGIFVALVRGPSGEDIQPKLAEAQIQARAAIAKARGE